MPMIKARFGPPLLLVLQIWGGLAFWGPGYAEEAGGVCLCVSDDKMRHKIERLGNVMKRKAKRKISSICRWMNHNTKPFISYNRATTNWQHHFSNCSKIFGAHISRSLHTKDDRPWHDCFGGSNPEFLCRFLMANFYIICLEINHDLNSVRFGKLTVRKSQHVFIAWNGIYVNRLLDGILFTELLPLRCSTNNFIMHSYTDLFIFYITHKQKPTIQTCSTRQYNLKERRKEEVKDEEICRRNSSFPTKYLRSVLHF